MNHSLLVFLPGLLDFFGSDSIVGQTETGVWESANVHLLSPLPSEEVLPLSMIGQRANGIKELQPGPLRIASLKLNPPSNSMCWALDLVGFDKAGKLQKCSQPTPEEQKWLQQNLVRLDHKRLQLFCNSGLTWSCVLENGSPEYFAKKPNEFLGKELEESLPDGEDHKFLAGIIEDSINLLQESPFNLQRSDRGELPISALMPFGGGFIPNLPNLSFAFGQPIEILADQPEWLGIASLVKSQFRAIQKPLYPDWSILIPKKQAVIAISHAFQNYRESSQLERAENLWDQFSRDLLRPTVQKMNHSTPWRFAICSFEPTKGGIWAEWSALKSLQRVPFDERTLGDSKIPQFQLCETVQSLWR